MQRSHVHLPSAPPGGPSALRSGAVAVVLGVLLGVGAKLLPQTPLNPIVDTVAFWALCAFAVGAVAVRPRAAVLAAVTTEVIAVAVWYGLAWLMIGELDRRVGLQALTWGVGAIVAGSVFGLAGSWWRTRASSPRAELAASLPVAVELWAAVYAFVVLRYEAEGLWSLAIAVVLLVVLPRTHRDRLRTAVTVAPVTLIGLMAGAVFVYVVYDAVR